MMTHIAPWLAALVAASVKGSLLLLAGLAAARLMRRASAEARHAALALALGAFFILPVAGAIAPSWTVSVPAPQTLRDALDGAGSDADAAAPSEPTATKADDAAKPVADAPPPSDYRASQSASLRDRTDWPRALAALWVTGAALIALRLLIGILRLRFLARRATMVTDGGWLHTAHALARRLGLTRGVTLLRGDREAVPMTWGVLSPVVWLPPASDEWPSELRRAVLSHELAHVRRRDAATQWLANAAVAVHWFNPLVWIAVRALRAERERACDDAVLSLGVEADDYASQLLDMVRTLGGQGGPAPAMAMARRSQFEGRLLAILDRAVSRAPVGGARLTALAAMAVMLVLLLGGMRGVSDSDSPPAHPEAASIANPDSAAPQPASQRTERVAIGSRDTSVSAMPAAHSRSRGDGETQATPSPRLDLADADSGATSPATGAVTLRITQDTAAPATLLQAVQGTARSDTTLMLEIIAAAEGISASSDRVAVLERMAKRPNLEPEVVLALGAAAGRVSSSSERTKLLRTLVRAQGHATGDARRTVLTAIGSLTSSVHQSALLTEFIGRPNLSDSALAEALATSQKISSNNEKAKTLLAAAQLRPIEGEVRASYLKAARSITTDSDRARVLSALVDGPSAGRSDRQPPPSEER